MSVIEKDDEDFSYRFGVLGRRQNCSKTKRISELEREGMYNSREKEEGKDFSSVVFHGFVGQFVQKESHCNTLESFPPRTTTRQLPNCRGTSTEERIKRVQDRRTNQTRPIRVVSPRSFPRPGRQDNLNFPRCCNASRHYPRISVSTLNRIRYERQIQMFKISDSVRVSIFEVFPQFPFSFLCFLHWRIPTDCLSARAFTENSRPVEK